MEIHARKSIARTRKPLYLNMVVRKAKLPPLLIESSSLYKNLKRKHSKDDKCRHKSTTYDEISSWLICMRTSVLVTPTTMPPTLSVQGSGRKCRLACFRRLEYGGVG